MKNKTVLITGASGNLGRSLSINFAKQGANIILTARNIKKLESIEIELKTIGVEFIKIKLDVTNYNDCENAIQQGVEKFGKIDFIINNASGYLIEWDLRKLTIEDIEKEINTTYKGAVFMTKAIMDHFIRNKSGTIINISSTAGLMNSESNLNLYNANKSAIIRFSESMNKNLSQFNIRVSSIIPCAIRENNLQKEQAVSFDDVSKVVIFQCSDFDNLNLKSVILSPREKLS